VVCVLRGALGDCERLMEFTNLIVPPRDYVKDSGKW
jgi:hypothetical protein